MLEGPSPTNVETSMLRRWTVIKRECQHIARIRPTDGTTKLCQAVNRAWQDAVNAERYVPSR